jgi:protein-tyrosine phosphatase
MIDTHCHLLPGLDDGPPDDAGALELARALVDDEVRMVVCTPHYTRQFPTDHDAAESALAQLRLRLAEAEIPLELVLAAEVGPVFALDAPTEEIARRALAGRFVLVEVTPDSPAPFFDAVGERLAREGLTPVFAHPERSRALQRSLEPLADARGAGAVVQVVAPSLLGRWNETVADTAWRIVDAGLADLLASDAHGIARRRVHLGEAADEVGHRYGHEAARRLTASAPARVVDGLDPHAEGPVS